MKKLLSILCLTIAVHFSSFSQMKIGAGTPPAAASILELESSTQGFVLPRVFLPDVISNSPLGSTILVSTMVYNINPLITGGSGIGIYYWNGSKWNFISTGNAMNNYWSLLGNNNTLSSSNFLGTTDNNGLSFRTNNVPRMLIDSLGDAAIGSVKYDPNNRERLLVDYGNTSSNTLANFRGNTDGYLQFNVQNTNSGINSSSDIIATADNGTDTTNYVDLGINSSSYAPSVDNWGGKNDAYLYSYSRNLLVGTQAPNSDLIFMVSGGQIKNNTALRIDGATSNLIVGKGNNTNAPVGNVLRGPNAGVSISNLSGGDISLQGGSSTGTATGGNVFVNGGTSANGTGGIFAVSTSSIERMRVDGNGNVGIGTINPAYKLQVLSNSDPLYLSGVQTMSTFNADSLLTISNGVVKKSATASLNNMYWSITGNTLTNTGINFLGTTDNAALEFRVNNIAAGFIDSSGGKANTYFGLNSGNKEISSGIRNTAIGYASSSVNISGYSNVGVGPSVLAANTSGSGYIAIGDSALASISGGGGDIAIGYKAAARATVGGFVAIGNGALLQNAGLYNIGIGNAALQLNSTGIDNTAMGYYSMLNNTTGSHNTGIGVSASRYNTTGSYNTSMGRQANYFNATGNSNSAMGYYSAYSNTAGNNNTSLGYYAGYASTGSNNTFIGVQADATATALNNANAIGYNAKVSASNSMVLGDIAGSGNAVNIGIGIPSPLKRLHIDASPVANALAKDSLKIDNLASSFNPFNKSVLVRDSVTGYVSNQNLATLGIADFWSLTGNAGNKRATNFLGTADTAALIFKVNNNLSGLIESSSGNSNTFYGYQSGINNSGSNHVFLGYGAGKTGSGTYNIGIGYSSLANSTGSNNIALGSLALTANTTGYQNVASGYTALGANTTGGNNVATGYAALQNNTAGNINVALGAGALQANTTASNNVSVGASSLQFNTTGGNNIAVGTQSLYSNTTGAGSIAIGFQALYNNNTGYTTAIGNNALYSNTTGAYNTAIGPSALYSNTTGQQNTAIGYYAAYANTTGSYNFAVGISALQNNVTGINNTAIGNYALSANTVSDNTAIGASALNANTTGTFNTAISESALITNTTGSWNTAVGYWSLFANTTGNENSAIGVSAMRFNTTGSYNTGIGRYAVWSNTTGNNNTGIGRSTLYSNTTGSNNSSIGYSALFATTTGANNSTLGYQSGLNNTTGSNNIFIGYNSGLGSTTGSNNLFLGTLADAAINSLTNASAIGYTTKVSANNSLVLGDTTTGNAVNVGIGVRSPLKRLHIDAANISTKTSDSLKIDNLATMNSFSNKAILIIDSTTGYTGKQSMAVLGAQNFWALTGNIGTNSGVNFLGTTDNHSLKFKVNNTLAGFIDSSAISGNTFLGNSAGQVNTGAKNTAMGALALKSNITGASNVAIGVNALSSNVGGTNITAIGTNAMQYANNIGGTLYSLNTAVGYSALQGSTLPSTNTGSGNTAIGYQALQQNSSGSYNIAIGVNTLAGNSSGSNNTAMGYYAGGANTGNGANVYLGYKAGVNINGANNTAVGAQALNGASSSSPVTGSNNALVGTNAAEMITTGSNNVGLGYNTFFDNSSVGLTTGNNNIAVGSGSNPKLTTGSDNIAIGAGASPANVTTGSGNLTLGSSVDVPTAGGSNQMNIKNVLFGTGLNGTLAAPAGNLGIGTTAPNSTLQISGSLSTAIITVTSSYALTGNDYTIIFTGNATAAPTFTLPDPTTCKGRIYRLVNASSASTYQDVTLSRAVSLFNGTSTTLLSINTFSSGNGISDPTIGNTAEIQSDGINWWRIGL